MNADIRCANKACDRERDGAKAFCRPCAAAFLIGVSRGKSEGNEARQPDDSRTPDRLALDEVEGSVLILQEVVGAILVGGFGVRPFDVEHVLPGAGHGYFHEVAWDAIAGAAEADPAPTGREVDLTAEAVEARRHIGTWYDLTWTARAEHAAPEPGDTLVARVDGTVRRFIVRSTGRTARPADGYWAYVENER